MEIQEERQGVSSNCFVLLSDLSGKMFTFPQPTNTAHVRLNPIKQIFRFLRFTCLSPPTDLKRSHVLFSLSTPTNDNGFLIYWQNENQEMRPHVRDARLEYGGWDYKPNMWHSICTTWDSVTGLVQIWFDGKPSIRKYVISGAINETATLLLGQEQDSPGGGFDINESFVGMMSDVHIFTPGNVLNWKALDFQIIGNVLIENQAVCQPQFFFVG
uniref:Pentraxin family member n=1 Tax=Oryzias latipes TaxID=8090 RepID=A0A3P9KVA7_ORYLA